MARPDFHMKDQLAVTERAVRNRILLTQAGIALERVLRRFWPAFSLILAFVTLALSGALGLLRGEIALGLIGLIGLALLWLIWRGARRFRWPSRNAAMARMDHQLPGRPLAALRDQQALGTGNAATRQLWRLHLVRMATAALKAEAVAPDLRLASRDRFGLRLMAIVGVLAAVFFTPKLTTEAMRANLLNTPPAGLETGPSFEAWIQPPLYTGRPVIYLTESAPGKVQALPTGSLITLRAYGELGEFTLQEDLSASGDAALSEAAVGIQIAEFDAVNSGTLTLARKGRDLAGWRFEMIADLPPTIALAAPVSRAPSGAMELSYRGRDDYGVVRGAVDITLDLGDVIRAGALSADPLPRPDIALDLALPFSGGTRDFDELLIEDFSKHPWSGLPVRLILSVEDAAGQFGQTAAIATILPGRRFFDPMAAALVEQRRDLMWSPRNAPRVSQMLRATTHRPENAFDDLSAYIVIRSIIRRLDYMRADAPAGELAEAQVEDIAEALWQAALLIEDGSLFDAAERLRRAKERLSEALRNGATEQEMSELIQELREAMQEYMRQLAETPMEEGQQQAQNDGQQITQDMLQQLLDRIQELTEQGRNEEAAELLEQLQRLMENMRATAEQGQNRPGTEGEQAMKDLQETLRQQQELADDAFSDLQDQFNGEGEGDQEPMQGNDQASRQDGDSGQSPQSRQDDPNNDQSSDQSGRDVPSQGGTPGGSLAERQEALRRMLDNLLGQLPGTTSPENQATRDALGEAERNMGDARDNLRDGDLADALDQQSRALDNLRDGIRSLSEDMARNDLPRGQGGEDSDEGFARVTRDPLGRPRGERGGMDTDDKLLDGAVDPAARARQLRDEIRRRAAEQNRPEAERDYLKRLLNRF